MPCFTIISLAELANGFSASVRLTHDNLGDVVDTVMAVTGKDCNHSNQTLRNLKPSLFDTGVFVMRSGRRYATLEAIIGLVMILPGKKAKMIRKQFKEIIVRYLDGDRSMCNEVEANCSMGKKQSYSRFASKVMNTVTNEAVNRSYEMPPTSYVYATKSPAFPGLIKIGKTVNVPARVCQLNTSCAPSPHVIVAVAPTFDHDRDEKTAHAFFSSVRREGEFFELHDSDVINYFATHIAPQFNAELAQNIARLQAYGLQ
jgi:hypothetical protein